MPRRDSVEEAVVAFLAAPRLNKKLKHPVTGRVIAFSEVGDPKGAAVFVCVGMGLTRYVTAFYDELAATLRLRLITLDRPGVGGSEPYPSSDKTGPLGWAEDVFAICEHLRISKFSLLAHSAGAVYALATALVYPHFIKGKVHLLAPWVPPSQLEAISHAEPAPPSNPLPRSQRFLRVIPAPFLKAANTSFMTATSASLKPVSKRKNYSNMKTPPPRRAPEVPWNQRPTSGDKPEYNRRESMMLMDQYMPETTPLEAWPLDMSGENGYSPAIRNGSLVLSATAIPTDPSFNYATSGLNAAEHAESQRQSEYTSRLTQRTWDLATRDSNPATDLLVCLERHRDVGFRYTDVGRDMIITHGSDDKRVPIANVKWLAEQINRRALALKADPGARELRRNSWAEMQSKTRCEVRVLPGEGHGLMASPSIMSDVLEEIAGYWRGHDRARER
jgi:pimeloyl-ACP methyl ester carboxylesterase